MSNHDIILNGLVLDLYHLESRLEAVCCEAIDIYKRRTNDVLKEYNENETLSEDKIRYAIYLKCDLENIVNELTQIISNGERL